eukprot:1049892-Pyramimonas_sp.AAC.1
MARTWPARRCTPHEGNSRPYHHRPVVVPPAVYSAARQMMFHEVPGVASIYSPLRVRLPIEVGPARRLHLAEEPLQAHVGRLVAGRQRRCDGRDGAAHRPRRA